MDKYDYQSEPGVQDATYQDFVAPMLAGLGIAPRLMSAGAPAIARGLAVAAPSVEKATEEIESNPKTVSDILEKFMNTAQSIGDWGRVFKYKALRSAMEEKQMPFNEVFEKILQIHAD